MPNPFFTIAVPSPGNFLVMSNGYQAPTEPADLDDALITQISIWPAFLARLPLSNDGDLAIQFHGWTYFDAARCTYFRFRVEQPNWRNGPFLDHPVGTTEFAWASATRHFTPSGSTELFQWFGSYQANTGLLINPGFYNLSCTLIGADENGDLPVETAFTAHP